MKFLSNAFYENLKMALETLRCNKLRSFLTIFGVLVGVITVMLISSIISGIDTAFKKEIESYGTRSIFLYKFEILRTSAPTREERMRKPLTIEDAEALKGLASVETAVPFLEVSNDYFGQKISVTGKNGKTSTAVLMNGTLPDLEKANTEVLLEGRWFTEAESDAARDVCMIGDTVKESYFPFESSVGKTLEIGGREFTVVGVLQKREQLFGGGGGGQGDQSNIIYMPIRSALRLKPFADDIFIMAVAREGMVEKAKDDIADVLRLRRNVKFGEPNNFSIATSESLVDTFRSVTAATFIAMFVISSIGLLIGGIGVMNIMLVSVTERTREIGIRKAIGAKQSDILLQFLIEAATLTGFGGLLGLLIGWVLTFVVALFFPSYVPWWAPVMGFGASVGIGVVFGLWPAWKAARLDPIEALRYE